MTLSQELISLLVVASHSLLTFFYSFRKPITPHPEWNFTGACPGQGEHVV